MRRLIWNMTRRRAAFDCWVTMWFSSPKMQAKTERMWKRLEREHAILTKALG